MGWCSGQLLVKLEEDWTPEGQTTTVAKGSLIALDLAATEKDPVRLKPTVVFAPTSEEFEQWSSTTKNHLIVTTLDHVQRRAYVYTLGSDGKWTRKRLPVPDNLTIGSVATSHTDDLFFLGLEGFLTPPSLWLGDAAKGSFASREIAEGAVRRAATGGRATRGDFEGRHEGAVLCRASQGYAVRRVESHAADGLWRIPDLE